MALATVAFILALVAVVSITILGGLVFRFTHGINSAFRSLQTAASLKPVYVDELEDKVDTVWRALVTAAAAALHSPHAELAARDALLEAFMNETITKDQTTELISVLNAILANKLSTSGDKMAATVMLKYLNTVVRIYRTS
jgi:hypothetical protein